MNDEKTYTAREVVERERAAYIHGVQRLHIQPEVPWGPTVGGAVTRVEALASALYPLPTVTRPRVVPDPTEAFVWSVRDGALIARHKDEYNDRMWFVPAHGGRTGGGGFIPTAERVALWADLLANSTEEVEA